MSCQFIKRLKILLLGISILAPSYASAVLVGGAATLQIGSVNSSLPCFTPTTADLPYLVTLMGAANSTSGGNYYGFYSSNAPSSNAMYSVSGTGRTGSGSPKLYVFQVCFKTGTGGALAIGTADAAPSSEGAASGPTGAIFYAKASNNGTDSPLRPTAANVWNCVCTLHSWANGKFPFWVPGSGTTGYDVQMFGVLQ